MNLQQTTDCIDQRMRQLGHEMVRKYAERYQMTKISFDYVPGKKYIKMILRDGGTSVHAFICKQTGAVYKPASWKAPAKYARYNLLDDVSFTSALERCDWHGSYLYLK